MDLTIDGSLLMEGFGRIYPTSKQGSYTTYGLAARDRRLLSGTSGNFIQGLQLLVLSVPP